jgi:hypothetical protein
MTNVATTVTLGVTFSPFTVSTATSGTLTMMGV